MMPVLTFNSDLRWFVFRCAFDERNIPDEAGFVFDSSTKCWATDRPEIAFKLRSYADDKALGKLAAFKAAIKASAAVSADIDIPAPRGLEYLPFQKAGIQFALSRPNTLIADEMGLGKTIQAIGVINALGYAGKVLVTCPASLKINWARELEKWLCLPYSIGVVSGSEWVDADITIINYAIVERHWRRIYETIWGVFVPDESHYLKNLKARRTQIVTGWGDFDGIPAERKLFLTGTPILNMPVELYPTLRYFDPEEWEGKSKFEKYYCDAGMKVVSSKEIIVNGRKRKKLKKVYKADGASNLEELNYRLRSSVMVRRMKKDVLKDLPDKTRQIIELPSQTVLKEEQSIITRLKNIITRKSSNDSEYKKLVAALSGIECGALGDIASLRHETAIEKVPAVIEFLNNALESSDKIVVFAHHKEVIKKIAQAFERICVIITGDTPNKKRQKNVDLFQENPNVKLFIGNIQAAGVGLTLTASSHVVFAELDWVPGNVTQAEDRCHRIGQENAVLVQHLVIDGSIDAMIAKAIVRKQEIIDKTVDYKPLPDIDEVSGVVESALR